MKTPRTDGDPLVLVDGAIISNLGLRFDHAARQV
jgi:hypothetical protein